MQLKASSQEAVGRVFLEHQKLAQSITFAFAGVDSLTIRFTF